MKFEESIQRKMVEKKPEPIFQKRFGIQEYEVFEGDKEKLEQWFSEMKVIYESLLHHDKEAFVHFVDEQKLLFNTKGIDASRSFDFVETRNFDEDTLKIQAMSLWVLAKRPGWTGSINVAKRFILGGRYGLSSFLNPEGDPNCLDTSILLEYFSKKFGVRGSVKNTMNEISTRGIRALHYYWQSDSGVISDIWEGYPLLGVFENEEEFKEKKVMNAMHGCSSFVFS